MQRCEDLLPRVVALSGGIGGAKLALGLYLTLPADELAVICNPGDDFEHLGLTICPDFDTVLYTLSGESNQQLGWGRRGETWSFMTALRQLGGESWFNLGDGDLALHVERTRRLALGQPLSEVAAAVSARFGLRAALLPASDDPVRTTVHTLEHGHLPFQRYFVEHQCAPTVDGFSFAGAPAAVPSPRVLAALEQPRLQAIVICPSNPFISIDPILAVPGIRTALREARVPVVGVSPLIGGESIKGPTAKMMAELGIPRTNAALAEHYGDLVDGWIIDAADRADVDTMPLPVTTAATLMKDEASKMALASRCLEFAQELAPTVEARK